MDTVLIISVVFFIVVIGLLLLFKKQVRAFLYKLSAKMQLGTLRNAIHDADKNKAETNRKNIVVFNTDNKAFEPVQKKQLKRAASITKNKSNKAMTPGRKKAMKKPSLRVLSAERVKHIENKSLYTTK